MCGGMVALTANCLLKCLISFPSRVRISCLVSSVRIINGHVITNSKTSHDQIAPEAALFSEAFKEPEDGEARSLSR